ncbi:DUF58 domain-containing protein [Singulisphaera sp. PoT]|uniref:DUF58 domain-containing protein n=1 Tax=Singulisphaera sp. PoT TaxID=3411797 RepID=UPI003BF59C13
MRTPLGNLILAAIAAALCGFFLHPQGFVVFFGLLVVTALGLSWPWLSVWGLGGSLAFDRTRCRELETVTARLTLRNRMPWGVWGLGLKVADEDGPEALLTALVFVPGWRTTSVTFEFASRCRGVYPRTPPRIVCGFPFGLWEASRTLAVPETLLVWPRTFPVAPLPELAGGHLSEGLAPRDRAGTWGDPMGVRPYRRGDPLRRVHWAQTARHGQLIICEVQSHASPRVQIFLDASRASHPSTGADGSREWSIRVAASMVESWMGQGAEVDLILDDNRDGGRGLSSKSGLGNLLDALARWEPCDDAMLRRDLSESRCVDGAFRVIITTDRGFETGCVSVLGPGPSGTRLVVLLADGFPRGRAGRDLDSPLLSPWAVLTGPDQVASSLRRLGKEVPLGV